MASKRKDSKGRILRTGETQRSDGMYMYRYADADGTRQTVYSWRLVETDSTPAGKRASAPLRELEKQIRRDTEDGIRHAAAHKTTIEDLFPQFLSLKKGLKPSTLSSYEAAYDLYIKKALGKRDISSFRYSDIKLFYISLAEENGLSYTTIARTHTILNQLFQLAVRDGLIRSNPTQKVMFELKQQYHWHSNQRHALTEEQQSRFIDFVKRSPMYYYYLNLITVLLGTGCRVGEVIALRWEDCDFERDCIYVTHNFVRYKDYSIGKMVCQLSTPKTSASRRTIPMLQDVKLALLDERRKQMTGSPNCNELDGYTGFVFQTKQGRLFNDQLITSAIDNIVRQYNKKETREAARMQREPNLLPHFSAHNLRHTFCTRFCENENDVKTIQSIMGHTSIKTTMDIYNETSAVRKKASIENLEGKIKVR